MDVDTERVKADAVSALRVALTGSAGVADAVRGCWYRHPLFASTLMSEALRLRFPPGCDVRLVTAFVARIRADSGGGAGLWPSREVEAVIRACLGELALLEAVPPDRFNYPEMGIAILVRLFQEWRPDQAEAAALFERVEAATAAMAEETVALQRAEEDWFAAGMHQSPFAAWADEMAPGEEG